MPDELERLFRALVLRIRDTRPEHLSRAFEVADILRTFVPYRVTRAEVGVDSAEDYEVLVLRLLSGERGLLFTDDVMQDDIRRELDSGNPDLKTLQAYGTAKVTLAQHAMHKVLEAAPLAVTPAPSEPGVPIAPLVPPVPPVPPAPPASSVPPALEALQQQLPPTLAELGEAIAAAPEGRSRRSFQARASNIPDPMAETPHRTPRPGCRFCGQALPEGRDVTFCPHCGQNLKVHRCPGCSAEVESGWKFCVTCGRAASG
ncbi:MAG: zinc ribbon domain-containing protein [Gemmatimonadaceae bacterium]